MISPERLNQVYCIARDDLLAQRVPEGHWVGELSSSPLSTATAISALMIAEQHGHSLGEDYLWEEVYQTDLSELVVDSLYWLADQQNEDGGWGDTDQSRSNISTTMLVRAAFHLTGVPVKYAGLLERADQYIKQAGGIPALRRRYGKDKTFAVPILTNCALAGLVPWREVSALPFELACLPPSFYRFIHLPVVSYAIPALVAIGQAKYFHQKPKNPLTRWWRAKAIQPSLEVLRRMQPASGGFLEATPLTSFVVMSLASVGEAESEVVRKGVEFLLSSVRSDGSWPIDTNLATWNTSLSLGALASAGEDLTELKCHDWLLNCQHRETHPYTGAAPGGWAWTDLSGGVPDADDTPGALLALSEYRQQAPSRQHERIDRAAYDGVKWLLDIQNRNGGWPTFCRGWGHLPFDRSGSDLTAHAMRALHAWRGRFAPRDDSQDEHDFLRQLDGRIEQAIAKGWQFLERQQRPEGSWLPLWFGNQHSPEDENPIYGTSKVLLAYRDLKRLDSPAARRGLQWLAGAQQPDGGWGGGPVAVEQGFPDQSSSVEETALAVEALLAAEGDHVTQGAVEQGLSWLAEAVESGRFREASPIGFYFAKLWYHESLYPRIFTVSALGQAVARFKLQPDPNPTQTTHLSGI